MSKLSGDPGYRDGWCIHYRYNRDLKPGEADTCEAGVDYATFRIGVPDGVFVQKPCFLDEGHSKPGALPCPNLRIPTPEEIAAHREWMTARMNRLAKVLMGIADWRKAHQKMNFAEVVTCPACNGQLHLSIARNGHIHGMCNTAGCVQWIE